MNHRNSWITAALLAALAPLAAAADGVFVRFQMVEPAAATWFVKLGGYIHNDPWHLPEAVWPDGARTDPSKRLASGQFSPWFDLGAHAGQRLHGRLSRAGGVAEFPNVTVQFSCDATQQQRRVIVQLATAPNPSAVVKRFEESFAGDTTSFLVSPNLRADAGSLETASEMTTRRLGWARAASGGRRMAPARLWVQTQFWAPQRAELNAQEAEVLWLLGFNLVGNAGHDVLAKFPFDAPAGHHWVEFGPSLTRADIERQIAGPARKARASPRPTLYGFSDEIACRPPIGTNAAALAQFRSWLKTCGLSAAELGAGSLDEVAPIESPPALRECQKTNRAAANRVFLWTTRFRHASATQRLKWLTETFHRHAPSNALTSTLVADHPYFGGSGLGMGMDRENTTWGGFPLSLDWFSLARERVVDVIGIEDWLGLNFMYGPASTWEGFQLIGFQAAIFRSGSRGPLPIITWITPSDETNLRLKSASALCQGAKHFYYWTYGPTATSTENYWSDLRGAYDGIVAITRQLAGAEHLIAPGQPRPTRVALLYSLSSDLWQPFGYVAMAERRLTYFSLVHDQFLVDMLTEHDVEEGRLRDYDALHVVDPCVSTAACAAIRRWVGDGGWLYGACAAASRNEFNEEHRGLADVFGLQPEIQTSVQPGRFDVRGALNNLAWLDHVRLSPDNAGFGALGVKVTFQSAAASVTGTFADGSPAVATHRYGRGAAWYVGTCPAVSYAKDARFVPAELKERWPAAQRRFINAVAHRSGAARLVELSHPVVEAGVFEAPGGSALVLANFTYRPIPRLEIALPVRQPPARVGSLEKGPLPFETAPAPARLADEGWRHVVRCAVELGLNDIVLFE
ncbi:MAG: hypothetical protein JXQ71_13700 [Verrucomicrobia bacterium]|nr:hypothetical protein [Verrucomicrobiota bacterium]